MPAIDTETIMDLIMQKVTVDPDTECCNWTGSLKGNGGYGGVQVGSRSGGTGRIVLAHRFAYETMVGPIPEHLSLRRTCGNRACINPEHMRLVTRGEIIEGGSFHKRTVERRDAHRASTNCSQGHPRTPESTYVAANGKLRCRTCHAARAQRGRDKKKAAT